MAKITLMAMSDTDLENIEIERLHTYLTLQGYESERILLNLNDNTDVHYTFLDMNSQIYNMTIYSESSVYPESLLKFAELARVIKSKKRDSIIVMGGKFASVYYKEILEDKRFNNVDYIVLGDEEYTLESLAECMKEKRDISQFVKQHKHIASRSSIKGKEILNININEMPIPERSFPSKKNYENYYAFVSDSTGCCMKCAFCTRGQFYNKWSGRSAESIFYEIKKIIHESTIKCFWFTGGSFEDPGGELGIKKIKDFCELIINEKLKVSMRCYLRSNFVSKVDDNLLRLMKSAGFHVALVGIEAGNDFDLKLYNKGTTVENNWITLRKLKEAGIYSEHFGFIMLNPYSTPQRLRDNFLFLEAHQPHDLDNYVHHVFADPGTIICKKIEEDGLLIPTADFLEQGLSYKFVDSFAADVSQFLRKYFLKYETETAGISTFMFHLIPFVPNGKEYEEKITNLMSERAKFFSEYFRMLYIDMDISACERQYKEFRNSFNRYEEDLAMIKNRFIRDLVKYKIM